MSADKTWLARKRATARLQEVHSVGGCGGEYNSVDEYQEFSKAHEAKELGDNLPCRNIDELDQSKRKDHVLLMATDYLVISRDTGEMVWKGTVCVVLIGSY